MNELQQIWERALLDIELSVSPGDLFHVVQGGQCAPTGGWDGYFSPYRTISSRNGCIKSSTTPYCAPSARRTAPSAPSITSSPRKKTAGGPASSRKSDPQPTISMPLHDYYVNKDDNLNPRYSFDSFVVGPFNELAHAAARAVVKNPGQRRIIRSSSMATPASARPTSSRQSATT